MNTAGSWSCDGRAATAAWKVAAPPSGANAIVDTATIEAAATSATSFHPERCAVTRRAIGPPRSLPAIVLDDARERLLRASIPPPSKAIASSRRRHILVHEA